MTATSKSKDDDVVRFGDLEAGDFFVFNNGTCMLVLKVLPSKKTRLITSLIDVMVLVVTPSSFVTERRVGGRDAIFAFSLKAKRFKRKTHAEE